MAGSHTGDQTSMDGAKNIYIVASMLPGELLQVLGQHLTPNELRSARLVCKSWATALAVSMPTMNMALPHQASQDIFRQPLVLCSSGPLGSTQSASYAAVPRAPMHIAVSTSAAFAGLRPTPFATERGQAVVHSTAAGSSGSGALRQSPFIRAADSLPPGAFTNMKPHPNSVTAAAAGQPLQWQNSSTLQSWSSLPASGLKTCSSLQQLNLQLSGAPPSPQDLLDLSSLPNLTHLSLRQVSNLGSMGSFLAQPGAGSSKGSAALADPGVAAAAAAQVAAAVLCDCLACDCSSSGSRDQAGHGGSSSSPIPALLQQHSDLANAGAVALASFHISSPMAASSSSGSFASLSNSSRSSSSSLDTLLGQVDAERGSVDSDLTAPSFWGSDAEDSDDLDYLQYHDVSSDLISQPEARQQTLDAAATAAEATPGSLNDDDLQLARDQQEPVSETDVASNIASAVAETAPIAVVAALQQSVSCSVLTPEHVHALVQLPHLSSLELHPTDGHWDAAGTAALLQLSLLTGLTRLVITWGNADSVTVPLSHQEAVEQAHGVQLPLQQCLLGLTRIRELELRGSAVVDVQILQGMQQLQKLTAEALRVVNSDVLLLIQEQRETMTAAAAAAAAEGGAEPAGDQAGTAVLQQQQQRSPKWGTLLHLEHLNVIHPASDISLLLQGTRTPVLSTVGFVARGSGDFARLLSQHGREKIRVLHLIFPANEPWHTIAVVRLPTALPSLKSLTLEGGFWLPNSLIVGLGVMEVPLDELSLKCKLAVPCLDRLQHLRTVTKLGLHHVPPPPGPPDGLITKDTMLQLPAKLLPPGLRELEISNGWILH